MHHRCVSSVLDSFLVRDTDPKCPNYFLEYKKESSQNFRIDRQFAINSVAVPLLIARLGFAAMLYGLWKVGLVWTIYCASCCVITMIEPHFSSFLSSMKEVQPHIAIKVIIYKSRREQFL